MNPRAAFWLVIGVGLALRLAGLGYGLPAVFNSDEPHLVNLAVSFGKGSLRPELFKYPTLYPYLLFVSFGAFFAVWSVGGLRKSVADFGAYFAWSPGPFYLLGRALSAAASLAALLPVHRAASTWLGPTGALGAVGLLAVSPVVVEAAHAAKPEAAMFALAAVAWGFAAAYVAEGRRRSLVLAGAACGLAMATQYTAAVLGAMLASAWLARRLRDEAAAPADFVFACAAAAAGRFVGAPYTFLDFPAFRKAMADVAALEAAAGGHTGPAVVLANLACFGGPWLGGLAAAWGGVDLLRRDRPRALWLLVPVLAYLAILSWSAEGGWPRYALAAFPGLALLAGAGLEAAAAALGVRAAAAALAVVLLPGLWKSAAFDRMITRPDTRTLSARWIEGNVPPGKALLLDQESASPRLAMDRATVADLLRRTEDAGHPRARYYRYMLAGHPGGGWRVYRVPRDFLDLHSHPGHVAFSQAAQPILDVRPGLEVARKAGVDVVVLTSFGADEGRSPELAKFLAEVRRDGRRLAAFVPEEGRVTGPRIELYALR
ncbi:MAG: glycosyltransferase family 39 protein [Elusimicrobia bacterium]|nr:glycosyltransferase family 39 protein [Elusimicrobiota bacterium]